MNTKNKNFWYVARPLLFMCIALAGIIMMIHAANLKTATTKESCGSQCKKINADVLNAITIKLM